jgi:glyoxylase-like metal-dependent hydrolase (beta-lactamase superfamily II)
MLRLAPVWLACVLALGCQKQTATDRADTTSKPGQNRSRPVIDFEKVKINVVPVAGNIHMLEGAGGNIGVSSGPDGVLVIDDQFAPLVPKIRDAIAGIAKGEPRIEFVVNTHYHFDHTGGNVDLGEDAHIVAHTNVRKRLSTEQSLRGMKFDPLPEVGRPIITYDDSVSIHFNGEEVKLMHLPKGHTDGDSIVFFTQSKVVHMGDHFTNGMFPFVDLENGGDVEGYVANVAWALEFLPADVKLIPGHGALATIDDLRTFHKMLTETVDIVRKQMAAGKTLAQIQAGGLPAQYKPFGAFYIDTNTWIATIHASLSR